MMAEITTGLLTQLSDEERAALTRLRDELYPTHSLGAVARKLVRDGLVQCGVLDLPSSNRSRGAQRSARRSGV